MADASDIAAVRENTNEPTEDDYSDVTVGAFIDTLGVAGASAHIWRLKAAKWSELVTTTEGGTSHNFSDLSKNALKMADHWDVLAVEDIEEPITELGPIIYDIER